MPTINISGASPVIDPEYRYKMPTVFGKVEGRGNGIKTVIVNCSELAPSLHRDAGELNKFFGCELGAQTTMNEKDDRFVVNGSHTDAILQEMVHRYVEKFVLCPNCSLPETNYKIKNGLIHHVCAACGAKELVDMQHKLCTYILSQHKKKKAEEKAEEKKNGGKKKKDVKKDKKDKKNTSSDEDDSVKKAKKDKKKGKKDKKDKKEKKKDKKKDSSFEDGATDMENLSVDDATLLKESVESTKKFLVDNPNFNVDALVEAIVNEQMASGLKSFDKIHILLNASFTDLVIKEKQVEKFAPVLQKIVGGNLVMERHVISAVEGVYARSPKIFPVVLKQLYDIDILQEDTILEWASDGRTEYTIDSLDEDSRAHLRCAAEPVINWLEQADSDEESDVE
mmetsp:Transcript_26724/g.53294  ORF Transcript_26724/g.53294 Transcript_26724/m.53294 type:complete len:395 (-) Transcript_26724:184-1368(-)|eukprot:CAMPEP_0194325526 /NCGR_PEP_ID=MMETSP0171-20130528/31187_1 /TAXON_ID=218684 /ORGANISM="Corethron pennatum, Strain L29A3" /LENGTH=394 /DNA_ID=CAMNT_0039084705 /DNA_START=490 /DNA_END=1674 /DNA_ORIENTATION=-